MNGIVTPQENLVKARTNLAGLIARGADPRAIGLWRSKVAQAERLAADVGKVMVTGVVAAGMVAGVTKEAAPVIGRVGARGIVASRAGGVSANNAGAATVLGRKSGKAGPCLCGCGLIAQTGRFIQGHDSKFASMIRRLDKGIIKADQLPQRVQEMISNNHEAVAKARLHNKV